MSWLDASLYAHANTPSARERSDDMPPDMKPSEWLARLAAGMPGTPEGSARRDDTAHMRGPTGTRTGVRKSSGQISS